jgi:hypothetical protein
MKLKYLTPSSGIAVLFVLLLVCDSGVVLADRMAHYRVTIDNLTGQPFSPPVAATHQGTLNMFKAGAPASAELEAIAEDGNQIPMFDLFSNARKVTEAIDVDAPLVPKKATTFRIKARPGDRLSLATMMICTNDGFTGLNRARLPKRGAEIIWAAAYDAGTENNTELSVDIVDPCSALGPISLSGDPNGNENDAVDTNPPEQIQDHPNVQGVGDLTLGDHAWTEPVAKITITHVADDAIKFLARLSGAGESPPLVMATNAWGQADFTLNDDITELSYRLTALRIESGAIQAAIHQGLPDDNGPVVAVLYGPASPAVDERLNIRGRLTQSDLVGPLAGDFAGFVDALRAGELYVNTYSNAYPAGEIRGQVGAK